ncbi:MAG: aldehyde ferredoxin oxidoreductase C-terminal domain-containing protein [Chloroflexota bacterium]
MNVFRINTRTQTLTIEPTLEKWRHLGGRGLLAQILVDEVPATCEPLGEDNKLIFAPGLLVGQRLSSCDRISIGGKSPLTNGVKESNAGGTTGLAIAHLGIKALILEDKPKDDQWQIIYLSAGGVKFIPAGELVGMGVFEAAPLLLEKYGSKTAMALIGPGGEMGLRAAGIQNLDKDRVPSRIAARGGLGALMGSKRIKAIVIDYSGGEKPPIADQPGFQTAKKTYTKALMEHPQTTTYRDYGTAAMANMTNHFGCLPTRGFSEGQFENVEKISGEHMSATLLSRSGESSPTHACMPGCTIQCSNIYGGEDGKVIVSPLEYETIGLMGSNLGIDDLDEIARLSWEVSDLGLDTIEIGAALGVAAHAGLLDWGDGRRVGELISEIRAGTPLGRILGSGAATAGRVLGVENVPAVKGQAMPAYDPRAIKGTGVTYATSPQGADHTCGLTIRANIKHTDPEGQAEISLAGQISMAGYDTLGACIFAGFGFAVSPGSIAALLNARYGWDVDENILTALGTETLKLEREFNRLAGFTSADDRIPEWMTREPVPPTNAVFDVPTEDLDGVFNG